MRIVLYKEDKSIDKIVELDCFKVYDTDIMLDKLREDGEQFESNVYHNMALIKSVNMIELYESDSDLMTKENCKENGWSRRKTVETVGYLDTHLKPEVIQLYFKTNSNFNHALQEIIALGTVKTDVCAVVVCKYNTENEISYNCDVCKSIY